MKKILLYSLLIVSTTTFAQHNKKKKHGAVVNYNDGKKQEAGSSDPGVFLKDWKPKKYKAFKYGEVVSCEGASTVNVTIDFKDTIGKVSPQLFGNNTGIWMGRESLKDDEFVMRVRDIQPPVLRFPGGNLANDYFWDATSEATLPPGVPDSICKNYFTSKTRTPVLGNKGNWSFNPEAFYEMMLRTGANASICVNYSYALYSTEEDSIKRLTTAAHYAAEWVREVNVKRKLGVKYWEVGNENWGQWQAGYYVWGRGFISPEAYGKHFCVFADSMKAADPTIKIGAVGFQKPKGSDPKGIMTKWNSEVLPQVADKADYIVLHSYFTKHGTSPSPEVMLASVDDCNVYVDVLNKVWEQIGKPKNHLPISMTEFNTHSKGEIEKRDGAANVSHTAGVFFAHTLGEFARQQYGQAMMWDFYNGYAGGKDHGMFASRQEADVPEFTPHPSYYHYFYYARCFGDRIYEAKESNEKIRVYPTTFSSGEVGLVVINKSTKSEIVEIDLNNISVGSKAAVFQLTNEDPLSRKVFVNGETNNLPAGGPLKYYKQAAKKLNLDNNKVKLEIPAISATYIVVEKK